MGTISAIAYSISSPFCRVIVTVAVWTLEKAWMCGYTGLYSKGDLLITPADTALVTQANGDVQIVQIRIQDAFVRQVAGETLDQGSDRVALLQAFQTRDPQIEAIATILLAELHQESWLSLH